MPQKKSVIVRNTRHVDGIKEMIDIVRHQQAPPVLRKPSGSDLTLQRRDPLPGISASSGGGSESSPRSGLPDARWNDVANSLDTQTTDNDVEYDLDDLYPEAGAGRRPPSPPFRSGSVQSSKAFRLSRSLDTSTLAGQLADVRSRRRLSFHDPDHSAVGRSVRNLPPVKRRNGSKRSRPPAPVPHLDLSGVIAMTPDGEEDYEPSAFSPDHPSPLGLTDELFGEEGESDR